MKASKRRTRGMALLITASVLVIMATMGVVFIRSSTLDKKATANYVDSVRARLVAAAGVERAMRSLYHYGLSHGADYLQDEPWVVDPVEKEALNGIHFPTDMADTYTQLSYKLTDTGQDYLQADDGHKVFCSGVLSPTYEQYGDYYQLKIYDCAGQINVNMTSTRLDTILENLGLSLQALAAESDIIAALNPDGINPLPPKVVQAILQQRPVGGFKSKEQLREIVGARNYKIIRDFITVNSWFDPNVAQLYIDFQNLPKPEDLPVLISKQRLRAPININTAPRPVLEAVLTDLNAYLPYFVTPEPIEYLDPATGGYIGITEQTVNKYQFKLIPITGFDRPVARAIARKIIAYRWRRPFKSWEQFERFIDKQLKDGSRCLPNYAVYHSSGELDPATWYQACRDLLKANFNPNTRDARFNPNSATGLLLSKGDLYSATDLGSTTEFCFSSMGRYEINSQGVITANSGQIVATAWIRACVECFKSQRHTSQADFEKTGPYSHAEMFSAGGAGCASFPVNMCDLRTMINDCSYCRKYTGWVEPLPQDSFGLMEPPIFVANFENQLNADSGGDVVANQDIPERQRAIPPYPLNSRMLETPYNNRPLGLTMDQIGSNILLEKEPGSDLRVDGVFSHYLRNRYLVFKASPGLARATPIDQPDSSGYESVNYKNTYNLPYYEGAVEFWVKLAVDSKVKVPCGMIGATQVIPLNSADYANYFHKSTSEIQDWKEGVQFFIFKSPGDGTVGGPNSAKLRVVRLYYGKYLKGSPSASGYDITTVGMDSSSMGDKWSETVSDAHGDTTTDYPRFLWGRQEILVDIDWRAHEWHHVVVSWKERHPANDHDGQARMVCWIDGVAAVPSQMVQLGKNDQNGGEPSQPSDPSLRDKDGNIKPIESLFVSLNAVNPEDSLYLGGFLRFQGETDGIFKYVSKAHITLNGTLDSVRIYRHFQDPANLPVNPPIERYCNTNHLYRNVFTLPAGAELGYLSWTVYRPRRNPATGLDYLQRPGAQIKACLSSSKVTRFTGTAWSAASAGTASLSGTKVGVNEKLYYQVRFKAPGNELYNSPAAFDDITITYSTGIRVLGWEYLTTN